MNVSQVIDIFDEERPNSVKPDTKMRWLKQIENRVIEEIVNTHVQEENEESLVISVEPKEDEEPKDYFDGWGMDFELYIPEDYVDVYVKYLDQKTCQVENDMAAYNVAGVFFNNIYNAYYNFYNRTHEPKQVKTPWLDHTRL